MKKLLVFLFALLAFLCFSGQAFGQAYPGTVLQNSSGNYSRAVPYPQVLVCVANDGNVPCVTRAITYSDSTLGTQCTQTGSSGLLIGNPTSGANCNNPGIGDVNGNFQLYLANGQYTLCTFSGTWLCQQFTLGGAGNQGNVGNCSTPNSVAYYSVAGVLVNCDALHTDDGAGHVSMRSLQLTDPTYAGFFAQTAGGFPPLGIPHSVFVSAPGVVSSTYGINWPSALPSNGDCVSWTTSGSTTQFTDTGSPCGSGGSAASTYRTCTLIYGADNGGGLVNLDIGPQGRQCLLPYNATIVQVEVAADSGTPSVLLADNHQGSDTNILSSALSTAASGGVACATTGGGLGFDGVTTCSATLQNTSASQGDYLEAVSGSASTAHRISIFITFTQPNFTSGGTVTSVGQQINGGTSSGIFSVSGSPVLTAGNLNIATAGTSGGVPYFSSSSVISSSAALTANLPVIGGGAGVAPSVGTVTGNTTKFATSTGALVSGDCAKWDVNGNVIDAGAACGGGGGSGAPTMVALEGCSPDTSGNVFWTAAALTNWRFQHWEWNDAAAFGGTDVILYCYAKIPHTLPSGTAKIVLDFAANDGTAAHTMTFKTCDVIITTGSINVGSPTCASTQNFTTTSTAYQIDSLVFTVQSTVALDNDLVVAIHATAQSSLAANVLLFAPHLEWQ